MTKKIFRSILLTSLAVMLISLSIAFGCLYYYFGNMQEQRLDSELSLAAAAVAENGSGYLERLESGNLRLTLVNADGTVLCDTDADAAAMENVKSLIKNIRQLRLDMNVPASKKTSLYIETSNPEEYTRCVEFLKRLAGASEIIVNSGTPAEKTATALSPDAKA